MAQMTNITQWMAFQDHSRRCMRLSIATSSRTAAQQADLNALAERDPALKEILEYLGGCREGDWRSGSL